MRQWVLQEHLLLAAAASAAAVLGRLVMLAARLALPLQPRLLGLRAALPARLAGRRRRELALAVQPVLSLARGHLRQRRRLSSGGRYPATPQLWERPVINRCYGTTHFSVPMEAVRVRRKAPLQMLVLLLPAQSAVQMQLLRHCPCLR